MCAVFKTPLLTCLSANKFNYVQHNRVLCTQVNSLLSLTFSNCPRKFLLNGICICDAMLKIDCVNKNIGTKRNLAREIKPISNCQLTLYYCNLPLSVL